MTDFNTLARRFAAAGTLDDADLRALTASASLAPVDAGLAESIGCVGGSEISVARAVGELCAERSRLERSIRAIIAGELRPAHADPLLWAISQQRGRPPADIAQGLGVMADWRLVADALERRLSPAKPAATGGALHDVA